MVPHLEVEAAILEAAGADEQRVAVTSLPDPKRGERLVVLHTALGAARRRGLPRGWPPARCRGSGSPRPTSS